jgi:cell division protease FtsH
MKSDRIIDEYVNKFRLKFAIDELTRMPLHIVADKAAETQLELFPEDARLIKPNSAADDDSDDCARTARKRAGNRDHDARGAIVKAAIQAATTADIRKRLDGSAPLVVVVDVPSSAWVKPVEEYFDHVLPGGWATFARDGSNKGRDKAGVGNDEAARKISAGRMVAGIAPNPKVFLPAALQAAADITIKIAPPTGVMVRNALKLCLRRGRLPGHVDDGIVADLEFDDLVAAMRAGSTPSQAIERMRETFNRRNANIETDKFPPLENAVEYGEAQKWGLELARDLEAYRAGTLSWSEIGAAAIFFSEPGCGKTWLANLLAAKCRIPLLKTSVADYFLGDSHLGIVLQEQRAAYSKVKALAARNGASLWFIDEIDAMPSRLSLSSNTTRGDGSRNADWWLPIINDFLLICDQAKKDHVILCGATNRIGSVDPALLRPGRFDRAIEIGRPNLDGIKNILRFHLGLDLQGDDLTEVARQAEGSTAAELMDLVRAARRRARNAQRPFVIDDLKSQVQGEQDDPPAVLRRIAVHEAAHAVTTVVLSIGELLYVTLQSRGTSGGHTKARSSDADLMTLTDIEKRVISILAAGVAERRLLGSKSIGSGGTDTSDDGIATSMIAVLYASTSLTGEFFHRCSSDDALATVRADPRLRHLVEQHLRRLEKRATDLVERYRECIDAVAKALAKSRYLTGDEVIAVMRAVNYLELISTKGADAC